MIVIIHRKQKGAPLGLIFINMLLSLEDLFLSSAVRP